MEKHVCLLAVLVFIIAPDRCVGDSSTTTMELWTTSENPTESSSESTDSLATTSPTPAIPTTIVSTTSAEISTTHPTTSETTTVFPETTTVIPMTTEAPPPPPSPPTTTSHAIPTSSQAPEPKTPQALKEVEKDLKINCDEHHLCFDEEPFGSANLKNLNVFIHFMGFLVLWMV